jgi:hypothetical protein
MYFDRNLANCGEASFPLRKMESVDISKIPVNLSQTTVYHILKDNIFKI